MRILERGETGFGMLIEQDAGYISYDVTKYNEELFNSVLNETFQFKPDQKILVDCVLQKWGVENRNGRIYPKEVLIPQVEKYMAQVKDMSALNEADHPDTSIVSLHNISHGIKDMWWGKGADQNTLYGKLELIVTPGYLKYGIASMIGDKVFEYMKRGYKIGISSRGIGSLQEIRGKNIVQSDFELICFDLVASPSTPGAYLFPKSGFDAAEIGSVQEHSSSSIKGDKLSNALDNFLI